MKKKYQYLAEGSDFELSLVKLLKGKKIKDINGYLSKEFDDVSFKICDIILEDNTKIAVEGEHDFPYLSDYYNILDPGLLKEIYNDE
jgi:hypothetical protein